MSGTRRSRISGRDRFGPRRLESTNTTSATTRLVVQARLSLNSIDRMKSRAASDWSGSSFRRWRRKTLLSTKRAAAGGLLASGGILRQLPSRCFLELPAHRVQIEATHAPFRGAECAVGD